MSVWQKRRILIWGKTRPELSRKHRETVCTGGVFEDSGQFVRLYPIPLRYLDDEHVFKKYQWVEADVRKAIGDARPESYNIRPATIQVGEKIETKKGDWSDRARWVLQPGHTFASVTALQEAREKQGTSIGMVKPDEVLAFPVEAYPEDEKKHWWARYNGILQQPDLPFTEEEDKPVRPISPPDFRFKIRFRSGEKEHEFSVFDWEVDALYFNLRRAGRSQEQACGEVTEMLRTRVCGPDQDTYFFLGNIAAHPHVFTIVGLWYPKKPKPPEPASPGLFDGVE